MPLTENKVESVPLHCQDWTTYVNTDRRPLQGGGCPLSHHSQLTCVLPPYVLAQNNISVFVAKVVLNTLKITFTGVH